MPGRDRGPLILAAELPEGTAVAALSTITDAAASDRGVEFVSEPGPNDPESPTAVMWELVPITGPQDEATTDLVQRLRDDVVPPAEDATGIDVTVTGKRGRERRLLALPVGTAALVVAAFLALSFLLMMVVFWSLLVPLKAVIKNLVSIGAAYRLVVALFQWGWLSDLTDVQPVPIEPWAPMMLFAIVFGLSIDNDVFLLSRVREEWHRTGDSRTSVADGLAATAKVNTAAAIMVFVFGTPSPRHVAMVPRATFTSATTPAPARCETPSDSRSSPARPASPFRARPGRTWSRRTPEAHVAPTRHTAPLTFA
jgi:putative drug exporter of the RND superfamily